MNSKFLTTQRFYDAKAGDTVVLERIYSEDRSKRDRLFSAPYQLTTVKRVTAKFLTTEGLSNFNRKTGINTDYSDHPYKLSNTPQALAVRKNREWGEMISKFEKRSDRENKGDPFYRSLIGLSNSIPFGF